MRFLLGLGFCLLFSGCSNHPLVDDTTDLSTYDIIHKVRCEAADELHHYLSQNKLNPFHQRFEALRAEIAEDEKFIRHKPKNVQSLEDKFAKLEASEKSVRSEHAAQTKKIDRQDRLYAISVDETLRSARTLLSDASAVDENSEFKLDLLISKAAGIAEDVGRLEKERRRLTLMRREIEEERQFTNDSIAQDRLTLQCGEKDEPYTLSSTQDCEETESYKQYENYKSVADRVKLNKESLTKPDSDFSRYHAFATTNLAMQFRFQITEDDNGSADGSIVWPVAIGTITLGYTAGKEKKRFSERTVAVSEDFSALLKIRSCKPVEHTLNSLRAHIYPVTGNIGVGELIYQFIGIHSKVALAKEREKTPSKAIFHEKLQFTTTLKGGLEPSFVLTPNPGHTIKFDGDFNANRTDLHEVIVDIAPGAPSTIKGKEKGPATTVSLDTMPELQIRLVQDPDDGSLRPLARRGWQVKTNAD
jgi:hypothetical protein